MKRIVLLVADPNCGKSRTLRKVKDILGINTNPNMIDSYISFKGQQWFIPQSSFSENDNIGTCADLKGDEFCECVYDKLFKGQHRIVMGVYPEYLSKFLKCAEEHGYVVDLFVIYKSPMAKNSSYVFDGSILQDESRFRLIKLETNDIEGEDRNSDCYNRMAFGILELMSHD